MVGPWEKVSFTHTQFQAAATQNDIEAFSLLQRQVIHGMVLEPTIQAAGAGITNYQISVGIAGTLERWLLKFSVNVAVGSAVFAPAGPFLDMLQLSAATSVRIAAFSTGANLSASTAGAWTLHFLRSTILS